METRHRKRSRAATSALWEVSPPAECVDGGAVGEDFPPLLEEAQEHLPEAAGGARRMELRCRPARVATSASRRVQPPVERIHDAVSAKDSNRLLRALQALPETAWTGSGEGFGTATCRWIDLPVVRGRQAVGIPHCLEDSAELLQRCVQGLVAASGQEMKGRCSISRYMPSGEHKPKQWVLRPHSDDSRASVSMILSLRSQKSGGGALVVSALASGRMHFLPHRPNTVDTRRNSTKEYEQRHGQVLKFSGQQCDHFVKYTTRACRYSLLVFMQNK
jgi:hypothetical protein